MENSFMGIYKHNLLVKLKSSPYYVLTFFFINLDLVMGIIVISLAKQIPRVRGKLAQTIIVILLSGLLLIGYALELKFFRIKAPVYPLKVIL